MDEQWLQIPYRVQELYIKYAYELRQLMDDFPDNPDAWALDTEEIGIVKAAEGESPWLENAQRFLMAGPKAINAAMKTGTPLKGLTGASRSVQSLLGGPNPLTSALLYGTLGAGLGWGSGKLLHMLMPTKFKKDVSWRLGLPLGALLAGGSALALHGGPNVAAQGLRGLISPSAIQRAVPAVPRDMEVAAAYDAPQTLEDVVKRASAFTNTMFAPDDDFQRASMLANSFLPDVDVPYWMDVVRQDPFMSPPVKAVVGGLVAGAGAAAGSRWVRPTDVARVAANAGLGAAFGSAIGMVAGPVLRLTPEARNDIQRAGMLAGIFKTMGVI
jgi:hypothetical protein